jgi:hypothetical protein
VAGRALIMAAVVCRSTIEEDAGTAEADVLRDSVREWLGAMGVVSDLDDGELALFRAPVGSLTERQRLDGRWRSEGLAILGWALGRCELPRADYQSDPFAVAAALGFRHPRERTVLRDPQLRSPAELASLVANLGAAHQQAGAGILEVRGTPIAQVPESVRQAIIGLISERQSAARWLVGQVAAYPQYES